MRPPLIVWVIGAIIALELMSYVAEVELRLADLERLAVRKSLECEGSDDGPV